MELSRAKTYLVHNWPKLNAYATDSSGRGFLGRPYSTYWNRLWALWPSAQRNPPKTTKQPTLGLGDLFH